MLSPKKICLFGGTFDPFHEGHLHIAQLARQKLAIDTLIILPCYHSPHKLDKKTTTAEKRLQICKLASSQYKWIEVSDYEVFSKSPSYSYLTAKHFAQLYPNSTLYWLMGADQWNNLHLWKHPETLASYVNFIVCDRENKELYKQDFSHTHIASDHPASATQIRHAIKNNLPSQWLAPLVLSYITKQKLYLS